MFHKEQELIEKFHNYNNIFNFQGSKFKMGPFILTFRHSNHIVEENTLRKIENANCKRNMYHTFSSIISVSRQTYSSIETGKRKMTWNTFLSLILFLVVMKERQ